MKMILLDKNLNRIDHYDFLTSSNKYNFEQYASVPDIDDKSKELSNNLDYCISIYSPTDDLNDFYISFLNKTSLRFISYDLDDIKGALISDVFFSFNKNVKLLKKMKEVYKTGDSQKFYFEYYDSEILYRRLNVTIVKIDEFIYILGKDETDYNIFSVKKNRFFEDYHEAIMIVQNNQIVKYNKKFTELKNSNIYKNNIKNNNKINNLIKETIKEILKQKTYSYSLPVKIEEDNILKKYHILKFNFILYNNQPAVMITLNDTTESKQDKIKIENKEIKDQFLQYNLDSIQEIANMGLSYTSEGKYYYSPKLYQLLEIKPQKEDIYQDIIIKNVFDEDKQILKEKIREFKLDYKPKDFTIRMKTSSNDLKYIHLYIIKNSKYNKILFYYQDVTEIQMYIKQIEETMHKYEKLNLIFEKIQGISKINISYYDNETNTYTWYSEGYNMLDIDLKKYKGNMSEYLIEEDRDHWKERYSKCNPENPETTLVQRVFSNGKLRYLKTFVLYEYDENGNEKAHINLYQDITDMANESIELKEALQESEEVRENFNRIQHTSKTVLSYSNNLNDIIWTPEVFNILEINPNDYKDQMNHLLEQFILKEDLEHRQNCIKKLSPTNPDITFTQRIKTGKNNIKYIKTVIHHEYDDNGNFIKRIGLNQDITEEIKYQNELKKVLRDKQILLTEVHHRVKNNLQIILSLINMNTNFDTDAEKILQDTQDRIYAMALIHEKIYGTESLSEINMSDYAYSLITSLFDTYDSNIKFHSNMEPLELNMDLSIPIGLILNELVNNTIKHAFPDKEGNLYLTFKKENKKYTLTVEDDGIGLPKDFDLDNPTNFGLMIVNNLVLQIGGTITLLDCKGTGYKIEFEEE